MNDIEEEEEGDDEEVQGTTRKASKRHQSASSSKKRSKPDTRQGKTIRGGLKKLRGQKPRTRQDIKGGAIQITPPKSELQQFGEMIVPLFGSSVNTQVIGDASKEYMTGPDFAVIREDKVRHRRAIKLLSKHDTAAIFMSIHPAARAEYLIGLLEETV